MYELAFLILFFVAPVFLAVDLVRTVERFTEPIPNLIKCGMFTIRYIIILITMAKIVNWLAPKL